MIWIEKYCDTVTSYIVIIKLFLKNYAYTSHEMQRFFISSDTGTEAYS